MKFGNSLDASNLERSRQVAIDLPVAFRYPHANMPSKMTQLPALFQNSIFLVAASGLLGFVPAAWGEEDFRPRTVIKRSFPPIKDPDIAKAAEADGKIVRDEELVLGVVVGDAARAYPINTLTGPQREIINDRLGGRSIAATW